ncbi:MAG: cytochrome c family protein [Desulfobulbaceae bacterium]|nr:cytochrome c family protein [Desulfobulbaceae bacterium]
MFDTVGGSILFEHYRHVQEWNLTCDHCHHSIIAPTAARTTPCDSCHRERDQGIKALGANGAFDHTMHSEDVGVACDDCHHDLVDKSDHSPQACGSCHIDGTGGHSTISRTDAFHAQCIGCHSAFDVTPQQSDCDGCHAPRGRGSAFHDLCTGCHEDVGAGPIRNDADCRRCHGF